MGVSEALGVEEGRVAEGFGDVEDVAFFGAHGRGGGGVD